GRRSLCRDSTGNGGQRRLAHPAPGWPEIFREAALAVLGDGGRILGLWPERMDLEGVDRGAGLCLSADGVPMDAAPVWRPGGAGGDRRSGGEPLFRHHRSLELVGRGVLVL